jgi:hypothetical protein
VDAPQALAEGVCEVLSNSQLRDTLVASGLELARSCAWSNVRKQWLGTYREAMAA